MGYLTKILAGSVGGLGIATALFVSMQANKATNEYNRHPISQTYEASLSNKDCHKSEEILRFDAEFAKLVERKNHYSMLNNYAAFGALGIWPILYAMPDSWLKRKKQ